MELETKKAASAITPTRPFGSSIAKPPEPQYVAPGGFILLRADGRAAGNEEANGRQTIIPRHKQGPVAFKIRRQVARTPRLSDAGALSAIHGGLPADIE
jgi:hypothetical protein